MENTNANTSHGNSNSTNYKVKLMCSYGGKIQPRPNTNQLMYFGGDTKILTVDRNIKFPEIVTRLNSLCNTSTCEFRIKYQLPGEDLDALVSLIDDDDVEHMMFEYDRILKNPNKAAPRLRLFLFNLSNQQQAGLSPVSNPPLNPDFLFGFDKDYVVSSSVSNTILENQNQNQTIPPPALDLLQIPGMFVPGFSGPAQNNNNNNIALASRPEVPDVKRDNNAGGDNSNYNNGASGAYVNGAGNVYRIPVMAGGGQGGYYAVPGMVNWKQRVYNYVPAMPSVPEQKMMMVSMGDQQLRPEVKVNQRNA